MKNNSILIYIGIGILILAVLFLPQLQKKDVVPGITATYYDANGNLLDFQPYNYEEATKGPERSFFQMFGIVPMSNSWSSESTTTRYVQSGSNYALTAGSRLIGSTSTSNGGHLYIKFNPNINNNTLISVQSATLTFPGYNSRQGTCDSFADWIQNGELTNWNDASSGFNRLDQVGQFPGYSFPFTHNDLPKTFNLETSVAYNELREGDGLEFGIRGEMRTGDQYTLVSPPTLSISYTYECNQEATCSGLKKTCGSWNICGQTFSCGTCGSGYSCNSTGQCFQSAVYAKYQINVGNTGSVPYESVHLINVQAGFSLIGPGGNPNYFPINNYSLNPGQSANWTSSLIEITPYVNKTLDVFISGRNTYTNQTQNFLASKVIL